MDLCVTCAKILKTQIMKKQLSILSMAFIGCTLLMTSCKKPAASFTADKTSVKVGEAVNFTNSTTDAAKQVWDFGDGTQSTSTGATVSHVYQRPGNYTVSLMGTKKNGKKQSDAPTVAITVTAVAADFTVSSAAPVAGQAVTFTAASSSDGSEYDWDFGDGNSILADNPVQSHVFEMSGTYDVTLTVYGPNHSSVATKTMSIVVGGVAGNNVNWAMIVGKWNYTSKVVTDVRNGVAFTSTNASIPSVASSYTSSSTIAFTHEFISDGTIIKKDINGNYVGSGTWMLNDDTRITTSQAGTGSYYYGTSYGTYSVSATTFTITYVSTSVGLPSYTDYNPTPDVIYPSGHTQVVTTVYTYTK
jgi:PKD repeat protein